MGVYYYFSENSSSSERKLPPVNAKPKKSALAINAEYALFMFFVTLIRVLPLHAAYGVMNFIAWSVLHFNKRHGPARRS